MSNINLFINNANKTVKDSVETIQTSDPKLDFTLTGDTQILDLQPSVDTNSFFTMSPQLKMNRMIYDTGKTTVTIDASDAGVTLAGPQIYDLHYQRIGNDMQLWGILNELTIDTGTRRKIGIFIPELVGNIRPTTAAGGYVVGDIGYGQCSGSPNGSDVEVLYYTKTTFTSKCVIHISVRLQ